MADKDTYKYASYPEGFNKLMKDIKMPFYMKLMKSKFATLLITILIDG